MPPKTITKEQIKIFPNNFEAEQTMLCCIMIDGQVASEVISILKGDDFYNKRNKLIFEAMQKLHTQSISIDIVTVSDLMIKQNMADDDITTYLAEINTLQPSAANYRHYLQILKRDSLLRYLITSCNKIIEKAYTATDAEEVMKYAEQLIYNISKEQAKHDLVHISEHTTQLMSRIDQMIKDKSALRGIMTDFPIFDQKTNGLQKGDLIILAARPSVGKTSFALNIAANIANKYKEQQKKIAIFSLEMPAVHLAQRIVCNLSNVTMNDISSGTLKSDDDLRLWKITSELSNSMIYVDDSSMVTPNDILSKTRRLSSQVKDIDLIIVDYLQLMYNDKSRETSRQESISEISRMMKIIAKEINCPVIVLSQMSRGIESRTDKAPRLSDLRESGAIEQDADIVMFLSREDEQTKNAKEYNVILDIAKHRNGELAKIRLNWEGPYIRFTESKNQDMSNNNIATTEQ